IKLSTKGRYGVRIMLDLALHFGQGAVFLKDIAQRQDISEKYLWQLIYSLKNAGLISSTRGAHGGYVLTKPPEEITLKEIVSVLEGPDCLVDCVRDSSSCKRSQECIAREIWEEVAKQLLQTLESFTLAKMVEKQNKKKDSIAYTI
ncbi:MAG: Rrf2 family transcriptional regulator, partial [Candidatus Omnitrophota bacterium]